MTLTMAMTMTMTITPSKNHPQPCGIFYFLTHSARFRAFPCENLFNDDDDDDYNYNYDYDDDDKPARSDL